MTNESLRSRYPPGGYGQLIVGEHRAGGVLIGTKDAGFARTHLGTRTISAIRAAASGLLAERLNDRLLESERRAALRATLEGRAFHPVFQAIVDLATRETLGYEALTRFDSGERPDHCFA